MRTLISLACLLTGSYFILSFEAPLAPACCPAPPSGKPVVNADQTVIIIWDAATKTEHFIRKASFKSLADEFGFLIPTPAQPKLEESGNEAFSFLQRLTEPERQKQPRPRGTSCSCDAGPESSVTFSKAVNVLDEKLVAGFHAAVLEAQSAEALVGWLKENGYAFPPEVEAWARPYVEAGWKITALKVAKDKDAQDKPSVAASALRMSFKTDRPLFPYREPDSKNSAQALGAKQRLLRVYFLADGRFQGELTKEVPWTGKAAWANKLSPADRAKTLELLNLPATTGPAEWWLTEFEDPWPYRTAPADLYFSRSPNQNGIKRPPIIEYVSTSWPTDGAAYAIAGALVLPPLVRRIRRRSGRNKHS
ncbi:MAG TPA: DUF2330 domain-containing protein [Gemmataceae bacterium]|nr:DUF2330 domain-containing protein [Gemmataceae bacterium]